LNLAGAACAHATHAAGVSKGDIFDSAPLNHFRCSVEESRLNLDLLVADCIHVQRVTQKKGGKEIGVLGVSAQQVEAVGGRASIPNASCGSGM
jgi:hypothetical protein